MNRLTSPPSLAASAQRYPAMGGPLVRASWESTLDSRFRSQAAATPGHTAIVDADRVVDYATLDAWSDYLAVDLLDRGVEVGDRVALCLPRGAAAVAGILGILKSGAAYVPVSPDQPPARAAAMLAAASARVAVAERPEAVPPGPGFVRIAEPPAGPHPHPPASRTSPDDLAYVMFTSGSTGTPKGVAVEHRSVAHLADFHIDCCGIVAADRVLQFTVLGFDVSVQEIFGTLLCGAAIVVASDDERRNPDAVADLFARTGITVADFPPAVLSLLDPGRFPSLR